MLALAPARPLRHMMASPPWQRLRPLACQRRGVAVRACAEESISDLMAQRLQKVDQLETGGMTPYAYRYSATHKSAELSEVFDALPPGEEDEAADVAVCGRIMTRRIFGKLAFFTVQDSSGTVQLYLEKKRLGESFKPLIPRVAYLGTYGVACAYVAADANDKYQRDGDVARGVDALIWQAFASVIVPGFVVNRVVARPMVPTFCGLASTA